MAENKIVSILLPNLGGGGAEKVCINLSNFLIQNGWTVHFVLLQKKGAYVNIISKSIKIFCINKIRFRDSIFPLVSYFKKNKPQFIFVNMWPLTSIAVCSWILAGRKGKIFLVEHSVLSYSILNVKFIKRLVLKLSIKITYPLANKVIGVSEGVIKDIISLVQIHRDKAIYIHNPLTIKNRVYIPKKNPIFWEDCSFKILSVGRFTEEKNHKLLIKAFQILNKTINGAKLIILGDGYLHNETKEFVNDLGLENHIHLPGFVLDTEPFFTHADLFVLSSNVEGFGNVIVEALSFGVPVVSTNCPSGPSEILDGGKFGSLVPIKDAERLAEAIELNLCKEFDKDFLIKRSLDFSIDKKAQKYLDLLI